MSKSELVSELAGGRAGGQIHTRVIVPFSPVVSAPDPVEDELLHGIDLVPIESWPTKIEGRPCKGV